jgi:hypothetical protein
VAQAGRIDRRPAPRLTVGYFGAAVSKLCIAGADAY